jgi:hypothetical protein
VLRHNGYYTAIIAASLLWSFPNANVIDNFHSVDTMDTNEQILNATRALLQQWRDGRTQESEQESPQRSTTGTETPPGGPSKGQPLFLYINPHMAVEETNGGVDRNDWPATWRFHDRDRVRLLNLLSEFGIGVDDSEVLTRTPIAACCITSQR